MTLRRCPSCRTLCDAERDLRCFACGAEFGAAAAVERTHPPVILAARRDTRMANGALFVFALIGGIGVFNVALLPGLDGLGQILLLVVLAASAVVGTACVFRNPGPSHDTAGRVILKVFATLGVAFLALAALLVGLVVLIFVTCTLGIMP